MTIIATIVKGGYPLGTYIRCAICQKAHRPSPLVGGFRCDHCWAQIEVPVGYGQGDTTTTDEAG